jgi:hypothetical protein
MLRSFPLASTSSTGQTDDVLINSKAVLWFELSRSDQVGETMAKLAGSDNSLPLNVEIGLFTSTLNLQVVTLTRFDLGDRSDFSGSVEVVVDNITYARPFHNYFQLHFADGSRLTVKSLDPLATI